MLATDYVALAGYFLLPGMRGPALDGVVQEGGPVGCTNRPGHRLAPGRVDPVDAPGSLDSPCAWWTSSCRTTTSFTVLWTTKTPNGPPDDWPYHEYARCRQDGRPRRRAWPPRTDRGPPSRRHALDGRFNGGRGRVQRRLPGVGGTRRRLAGRPGAAVGYATEMVATAPERRAGVALPTRRRQLCRERGTGVLTKSSTAAPPSRGFPSSTSTCISGCPTTR